MIRLELCSDGTIYIRSMYMLSDVVIKKIDKMLESEMLGIREQSAIKTHYPTDMIRFLIVLSNEYDVVLQ